MFPNQYFSIRTLNTRWQAEEDLREGNIREWNQDQGGGEDRSDAEK